MGLEHSAKPGTDHLILTSNPSRPVLSLRTSFFEKDWSLGWVNFLLQEVGSYLLSSVERFEFETLNLYRFVYLPSSLAGKLEARERAGLEAYVQSGGTLVVEGPRANHLDCPGVRFSSKNKSFRSVTSVREPLTPLSLGEYLLRMPFKTLGWEIESQNSDLEVILEMEKTPVLFKRRFGEGRVFTLGFDFGLLLVGLQQGVPLKGSYRLQKLFGTQSRVIEPEDLVLKASLLDNSIPWADLFERFLFKVITQHEPVPRWWYFPSPYTGALISTHDEESIGADPRLETMCQQEKSEGVRGTLFVISDEKLHERWPRNGTLRRLNKEGTEIGLHWNRFKKPRFKLRSFKFGMHETSLEEQIESLQKLSGQPIQMNRTHYLDLGDTYDEHFRLLAAQRIPFDSTYGPNQGGRGYLFGTGYPYYGLTWEGTLSGVLELPFLTQETWGGADLNFLKRLIRESDENFHQCVVTNFHPHYTVLREEGHQTWLGSLKFAKERKQWIPTLGEFFEFFKTRSESLLRSRFKEGVEEVWLETQQESSALSFPLHISGGRKFVRATVDGLAPVTRQVLNGWFQEVLISIPKGSHKVEVVYEG